ncbi:MAG TPA: hypothetical protein VF624_18860 [Tepidisphaeraceae bacterium]|jgi:excisionase family DNA binding protein
MDDLIEAFVPANPTFSRKELAYLLGVKDQTLCDLQQDSRGPAFFKVGKLVRYPRAAVVEWLRKTEFKPKAL